MTVELWREIEEHFHRVADLPEGDRSDVLASGSVTLREAVLRLVEADRRRGAAIASAVAAGRRSLF